MKSSLAKIPMSFSFTDTLPPAVEWLKQNKEERFFLFVHGYDVHGPYYSPEPFDHMFDAGYEGTLRDHEKFYLQTGSSDSRSILKYIKTVEDKLVLALEEETIDFNDYFFSSSFFSFIMLHIGEKWLDIAQAAQMKNASRSIFRGATLKC